MAAYGKRYSEIQAAGAQVVAIAVDPPDKSAAAKKDWCVPYPILCDTDRKVITEWSLLKREEKGGIAFPAVYVIGADRVIEARSLDTLMSRVNPSPVIDFLGGKADSLKSGLVMPRVGTLFKGMFRR